MTDTEYSDFKGKKPPLVRNTFIWAPASACVPRNTLAMKKAKNRDAPQTAEKHHKVAIGRGVPKLSIHALSNPLLTTEQRFKGGKQQLGAKWS